MLSEICNDSFQIEIGQNQKENDILVRRSSQKSLWFHLHNMPSPHGILTSLDGTKPSKDVIKYIAWLIKNNSKAKNNHRVKIEYIELSKVQTTPIAGMVILTKTPNYILV
jgi:predicted ribosome quality control (RQC) complex YloA/Tae2 family protein